MVTKIEANRRKKIKMNYEIGRDAPRPDLGVANAVPHEAQFSE